MGESLLANPPLDSDSPRYQERRITIGEKTLAIPGYVQEQMAQLDELVSKNDIVAETFGFGLTRTTGTTTEVVDFITPTEENIFNFNSLFMNQDQNRLLNLLGSANLLRLQITDRGVALIANDSADMSEWMSFLLNDVGEINWSFARKNIQQLLGFELPKTLEELQKKFKEYWDDQDSENKPTDMIPVKSDWDLILTGGSVTITGEFIEKTQNRAQEIDAQIGFSMHHHPSLGIAAIAMQGKPQETRDQFYEQLLQYSVPDVRFMQAMGIDFFEIRTFGNPDHVSDHQQGTTSKFYRVEKILEENPNLLNEDK